MGAVEPVEPTTLTAHFMGRGLYCRVLRIVPVDTLWRCIHAHIGSRNTSAANDSRQAAQGARRLARMGRRRFANAGAAGEVP